VLTKGHPQGNGPDLDADSFDDLIDVELDHQAEPGDIMPPLAGLLIDLILHDLKRVEQDDAAQDGNQTMNQTKE
jgi:hypothetical protein